MQQVGIVLYLFLGPEVFVHQVIILADDFEAVFFFLGNVQPLAGNTRALEFLSIDGEYLTVLFNSNFYCIYGNDHEVSCSGFLFNGSSHVVRFMLNESERRSMEDVVGLLDREFTVSDNLQEEIPGAGGWKGR